MLLNYPATFFLCMNCGLCCRDTSERRRRILLTPADLDRITEVTKLPNEKYSRSTHAAPKPFCRAMRKDSGTCVFLGSDTLCKIYDSRPIICRCYPFMVEFDDRSVSFSVSAKDCPGLGRGEKLRREFFEKLGGEVMNNLKSCEKTRSRRRSH